jgi:PRTRC genetic system protein B
MDTSVNIGRSQDFRLCRALLVYGKSDYNGFPYRHPFVVVHEVVHDGDNARLAAGQLVTSDALLGIMGNLGQAVPVEILPERVLVRTADTLVWWMPASIQVMFFSDRGGDLTLQGMNGKQYPHPPLIFKVSGSHLSVRALTENKRPNAKSVMHMAPYWNCNQDGVVCTGSMRIPREKSVSEIEGWETAFFGSEFTHANGTRTKHPRGLVALWKTLQGRETFPVRYLLPVEQTLSKFVNSNDRQTDAE